MYGHLLWGINFQARWKFMESGDTILLSAQRSLHILAVQLMGRITFTRALLTIIDPLERRKNICPVITR